MFIAYSFNPYTAKPMAHCTELPLFASKKFIFNLHCDNDKTYTNQVKQKRKIQHFMEKIAQIVVK